MAITILGEVLTERHRISQVLTAQDVIAASYRNAGLVKPDDKATIRGFYDLTLPPLLRGRQRSRDLASRYYRQIRLAESSLVDFPEETPETDEQIADRYRRSLNYLAGGKYQRRLDAGQPEIRARTTFSNQIAGSLVRHTLDAGRDQVISDSRRDETATGFTRVTAGDLRVCYFCAMLASRVDYKEGSFDRSDARFAIGGNPMADAKVHDGCRCTIRPLFDDEAPQSTLAYERLWYDLSGNGDDPIKAFRSGYEKMIRSGVSPLAG